MPPVALSIYYNIGDIMVRGEGRELRGPLRGETEPESIAQKCWDVESEK
jgi:hypothetical protein